MRESVPIARYWPFVMYCVNGKPHSSLLIESTDSMILKKYININKIFAAISTDVNIIIA